jgi:hypothetical protein
VYFAKNIPTEKKSKHENYTPLLMTDFNFSYDFNCSKWYSKKKWLSKKV